MTAGVQNLEPAAYLPPPQSPSPKTDAKGAGSADAKDGDSSGTLSDFQSEMQLQDTGSQETKPADLPKAGSGKAAKKRDARTQDPNVATVLPVQLAEPQKQILPLVVTFAKPQDNAEVDADAQATPEQTTAGKDVQPNENQAPLPIVVGMKFMDPSQPAEKGAWSLKTELPLESSNEEPKQNPKEEPKKEALPVQAPYGIAPSTAGTDIPNAQILTTAPLPVREDPSKSQAPSAESGKPGASSERQPVSRTAIPMVAANPEPVAKAIQETTESASSSPAALAFAARLTANPGRAASTRPEDSSPKLVVPDSQVDRIPVRYAAASQILQEPADRKPGDGSRKAVAAIDQLFRTEARTDTQPAMRTDAVTPRSETAPEPAPSPSPAAASQHTPMARVEPIEPPAAPPTSPRDIRVRVPDNNGGSTQVRFVESGGEVRVSVRTSDEGLAQNLRTHLNDLSQRLADGGMPAEIWKPSSPAGSSQDNQHQPDRDGRGASGQGSDSHGGHQGRQQKRPEWLEEMETSLHGKA